MLNFTSSNDFLEFIQYKYFNPGEIEDKDTLTKRYNDIKKSWEEYLMKNPNSELAEFYIRNVNEFKNHEYDVKKPLLNEVIKNTYDEIINSLPIEVKNIFNEHVAISSLSTNTINAAIFNSDCGKYFAIIFNSELVTLLHKFGKLNIAQLLPESVVYCNRFPCEKLTDEKIKILRDEYLYFFNKTKLCNGPILHLNEKLGIVHIIGLEIQEIFIICHEIGHLINGDFHSHQFSDYFFHYIENVAHRKEYMADLIGFYLLLNTFKTRQPLVKNFRILIFTSIITLFDIFCLLKNGESETHPDPIKRLFCISDHFFGEKYSEMLEKSYHDFDKLEILKNMQYEIDSVEEEIGKYTFEWMLKLFKK